MNQLDIFGCGVQFIKEKYVDCSAHISRPYMKLFYTYICQREML